MRGQAEEVPQRIKGFITERHEQQREEMEGQASHNTYLVCPLRDDEVEAIRAKAYKFREKTLAQEHKAARLRKRKIEKRELEERRRLREAGKFVPDSGISCVDDFKESNEFAEAYNDPLLSTQFVRRECYWQLNQEQMQRAVAWYYGWDKWSEDPWGSFLKFCEWISNIPDNEMAVWAVNETSMGRDYLVLSILEGLGQLDYSKMTEKDLLTQIGYGAASFLHVKSYTGWDDFNYHYPMEPLPVKFVNERVSKVYPFDFKLPYSEMAFPLSQKPNGSLDIPRRVPDNPFEEIEDFLGLFIDARNYGPLTRYRFLVSGIYLWYIALDGARERAKGHPELEGFLSILAVTDAHIADLCQKLAPKGYRFPDENQAWLKLHKALEKGWKGLKVLEWDYRDVLARGDASTWGSLLEGVRHWLPKPYQAMIAGLKGQLGNSLLSIVKHDLIDATRKAYRKHEVTESQIDATRVTDEDEGDATPFLDTFPGKDLDDFPKQDDIDLKSLDLNIDKLTPKELWVIRDVLQGFEEGYSFDSKQGQIFRQRWGDNYQANKRAWQRAKARLKSK